MSLNRSWLGRSSGVALATASLVISVTGVARADVVGRLRVKVVNAETEKPVVGAKLVLTDSAGVRAPLTLTTDATGFATSPPLENRAWTLVVTASELQKDTQTVTVIADTTTDVEVLLEPIKEKTIKITASRELLRKTDTASGKTFSTSALSSVPLNVGNRQSLGKVIRSVPGFVDDSVNQIHPRGEHSGTSVYINGFLLPGAFQGRAGQFLAPDAIETVDVLTGAFAPEYGSETAAALNLTLKSGTQTPFRALSLTGGAFGTNEAAFSVGGQSGKETQKIGYFVNYIGRRTSNAVEAPQPDRQNAHNDQSSTTLFGNFDYAPSDKDKVTLTLNVAPSRTDIANRTGLGAKYAPVGQGYGYAGRRNADGTLPGDTSGAAPIVLKSQQDAGQDIYQDDRNNFGTLQLRRQLNAKTTAVVSIGGSHSEQNLSNNTPGNSPNFSVGSLAEDSSIEFHPTVRRSYEQKQVQASFTVAENKHTYKFGAIYANQSGNESYRFVPGSQTALLELASLDPRLVPQGSFTTDGNGTVDGVNAQFSGTAPTLSVKRSGYYAAAYAQDTLKADAKLTVNYGVRLDLYEAKQNLTNDTVKANQLSPRLNLAYAVAPQTIVRASYNRLFSQPPLAQGAIIGESVKPQRVQMVETSLERQIQRNQTAKIAAYRKWKENELDTAVLLPGTQTGVFATTNIPRSYTNGVELSYDLQPKNGKGLGGYASWANTYARVTEGEEPYNDHDQLNTISAGATYAFPSGLTAGLNLYYGSGIFSSPIVNQFDEGITVDNGRRQPRSEVNFRISASPKLLKQNGLSADFSVENLFDSRQVINFNSPFTGTRFQQGRRIMLTLSGKY